MRLIYRAFAAAGLLLVLGAGTATATPDASGSTTLVEPNGLYTVTKTYEVYTASNGTNPLPLAGNYTYIYTLTNSPGSFTCLIAFEMEVPATSVTAAGYIPGAGVAPSVLVAFSGTMTPCGCGDSDSIAVWLASVARTVASTRVSDDVVVLMAGERGMPPR